MFARPLIASALLLVMIGCETNRNNNDTWDTRPASPTGRDMTPTGSRVGQPDDSYQRGTVGQDDYQRGIPDRNTTNTNTQPGGVSQPGGMSRPQTQPGSTGGSAGSAAISQIDRTFVQEAAGSGLFEVQSAQLAIERNVDPQTTQIARTILDDHRRANQQLEAIASSKGIQMSQQLPQRYQTMLTQLRDAQGEQFVQNFHRIQELAHQEAIQLFQRQAREGQDPELRSFAQRTLPVLQQHLHAVEQHPASGGMDYDDDMDDSPSLPPMGGSNSGRP